MRFKGRMELEQGLKSMDIAPIINVIFLILIFLMFTQSFVTLPGLKVNLPKAATSEAIKPENIKLSLTADNVTYLNGKIVSNDELKSALGQIAKRSSTVIIIADRSTSLGRAVEIWDMARQAGVTQVNIATNQEPHD